MNLSQIILIIAVFTFGLYVFRLRTVLTDRIVLLGLSIIGMILVIQPELSTQIANRIGIGRGTDLLLYVFIFFCLFRFVGIASNSKEHERQLTRVVRALALLSPEHGPKATNDLHQPPDA